MVQNPRKKQPISPLRRFNNGLSLVVVALSLYIVVTPLWPAVTFWWRTHFAAKPALVVANSPGSANAPPEVIPKENTLVIPRLDMQETIYEGATATTLRKGVWHRPNTSNPTQASNTVLVGHRFTYNGPAIFYSLDKVQVGDSVVLYWQQKKYAYQVSSITIVPPTATQIEAPTADPILTIYTCTPLWTAKNRLIIRANLVEKL